MLSVAVIATISLYILPDSRQPADFVQVKRDLEKGIFFGVCDLNESYYRNPEFYPGYAIYKTKTHDYSRWGVHGYGAYPGEIGYLSDGIKKDQSLNTCTYVHSAYNIETYQGLRIIPTSVDQRLYVQIDPNEFVLYPTFPKINQELPWARKINITITAKEDLSTGIYNISFAVTAPSARSQADFYREMKSVSQDWYKCPIGDTACKESTVELRKKVYVNAGYFAADKFFKISIKVE